METCGNEYRAMNNSKVRCKRTKDHFGAAQKEQCNGFSDTCPNCGVEGCDGNGDDCKNKGKKK